MGPEAPELQEGTRLLDRYVVIDRIAGGGMASIYRATDERLQRVVCVKLLRLVLEAGSTSGSSSIYQATYSHFLQEALALSRLHHPNTLKIFDFGYLEDTSPGTPPNGGGRPFQVSEFLDAGNLEQHVKREGAIAPQNILAILEPIVGAMTEAHAAGIIHRDIKPSNILFARINQTLVPKLADFGIAHSNTVRKAPDAEEVSVVTLFSPRWAAPEQLAGGASGPATDVYSLALVTTFMLAGRPMFEGKEVRATFPERVMGDKLVARRLIELDIPRPIHPPLLHALAARLADRTATVAQFLDEIREALVEVVERAGQPAPLPARQRTVSQIDTESVRGQSGAAQSGNEGMGRVVEVEDRLDLAVPSPLGVDARVRLMFVPSRDGFRLNIKGLNCFVAQASHSRGRPAAAVLLDRDNVVELVSSAREPMGRVFCSFGVAAGPNRVFSGMGPDVVVPSSRAARAVAVHIEATGELIVMCSRVP